MKLIPILLSLIVMVGCGKKSADNDLSQQKPITEQRPVSLPEKEKEPLYIYAGTQFNDPFIPLDGSSFVRKTQQEDEGKLDPATLILKGILIDKNEKMASLSDSAGNNYIVKNKRLYNRKGEEVEGVVGIVKLESVVIITQDKTVRELKLKTDEEY